MKVLVWQWGRRGAGPRFAACLAEALRVLPNVTVSLSLCREAEIMTGSAPPICEMPVRTYRGVISFVLRLATSPLALPFLLLRLWRIRPQLAICAMPGPLDLVMAAALRLLRIRLVVVVHEADAHPGDGFPMQVALQRGLCRMADGLAVLCAHVGTAVRRQGLVNPDRPLIGFEHPPFGFGVPPSPPARPGTPKRLLFFGRLRPYKGLDLLADALRSVATGIEIRVVGQGPESAELDALRGCPGVTVENRWVPETEIGSLLAWSDAVILPYREASQSGVAAAAIAAGRVVIATRVGGLEEQLSRVRSALLCEPDATSLAAAISSWLTAPPDSVVAGEPAAAAWQRAGSALLREIEHAVPPQRTQRRQPGWRLPLPPVLNLDRGGR